MRFIPVFILLFFSLLLGGLLASNASAPTQVANVTQSQAVIPDIGTTTAGGPSADQPSEQSGDEASVVSQAATTEPAQIEKPAATGQPEPVVQLPQETVAFPFELLNQVARGALVNIFCTTGGSGALNPLSGSGVLIDSNGIILTNAHVAQYLLLEESGRVDITCTIRTGEPATPKWKAEVYYLSSSWMAQHASEITTPQPEGTGEFDFALLHVTEPIGGAELPSTFPSLTADVTATELDEGVEVLVASYPAGFLGGVETSRGLYPASTVTALRHLYTFSEAQTLDIVDLGGVILAQSGSSGGAVVSQEGRLVGLIATSSLGEETKDRALHAITLEHINRTLARETGVGLQDFLTHSSYAASFSQDTKPQLIELLITELFGERT